MADETNGNGNKLASRKWRITWWTWLAATGFSMVAFAVSTWLLNRGTIDPATWKGTLELLGMWLFGMWGGIGAGYGVINVGEKAVSSYTDVLKTRSGG